MTRRLVILLLACALAAPASSSAWTGNTFDSPTGNLVCKYRGWTGRIACGSYASQKIVSMGPTTRPVQGQTITFGDEQTHRLGYGATWNAGRPISCRSLRSGMRCQNTTGWFFLIDRTRIYVGRYGAFLYYL